MDEIEALLVEELDDAETISRILIKFRERFAKGSLYIAFDYDHRNKQIIEMRKQGKNTRQIAMTFRLSTRQVSKILKR